MPSFLYTATLFIIGTILRWHFANSSLSAKLMIFPHFKSPLNDLRELREMFYTYESTGSFFNGPHQVGQSEILLDAIYRVYCFGNKQEIALRLILACFEMGKMAT
jgi:hypothetical protein